MANSYNPKLIVILTPSMQYLRKAGFEENKGALSLRVRIKIDDRK